MERPPQSRQIPNTIGCSLRTIDWIVNIRCLPLRQEDPTLNKFNVPVTLRPRAFGDVTRDAKTAAASTCSQQHPVNELCRPGPIERTEHAHFVDRG
jgi:hypothetical protein